MTKNIKEAKTCHECGLEAIDSCELGKGHIPSDENLAPCVYCVRNRLEHTRTNWHADFYSETWTRESDKTPIMQDPDLHEQTLLRTLHLIVSEGVKKLHNEKLTAGERSPVIPEIKDPKKTKALKEIEDKAKENARKKAERLEKEKFEKEKAAAAKANAGSEQPKKDDAKKTLEKKAKPEKKAVFPAEGKINKYGFIYLSGDILAAFGVSKDTIMKLSIDLEGDKLIIRKA